MRHSLLVILASICILFQGCGTARFQPVLRDSTVIRYIDELRIRDSVVLVNIPDESSSQVVFQNDTSHLETSIASSDAWIDPDGKLHHTLNNKSDQRLPAIVPVIDRARVYDNVQHSSLTRTVEVERELTDWQEFRLKGFWWLLGIIGVFALWQFYGKGLYL